MDAARRYLRERAEGETAVTFVELFFDLDYVFAVTQISHLLLHDLSRHDTFHPGSTRAARALAGVDVLDVDGRTHRARTPQRTVSGTWVASHLIGLVALLLLIPVAAVTEPIVLPFLTMLVVVAVAMSDTFGGCSRSKRVDIAL